MNIVIKIIDIENDKYVTENHFISPKWNLLNLGKMISNDFKLNKQTWILNNNILSWSWNNWRENIELTLFIEDIWFSVKVKSQTGKIYDLDFIESDDRLFDLEYQLLNRHGIIPKTYKLLFNKKEIIGWEYVSELGMYNNCTIDLIIKLQSGF